VNGSNVSVQQPNDVPTLAENFNYDAFHIYGCLWTTNSVTWYVDNQPVMTVATGPGTNFTALEQDHMFLVLWTGANWPVTYDYVHVWH
jgi:beta-glucanase (GH16 family)